MTMQRRNRRFASRAGIAAFFVAILSLAGGVRGFPAQQVRTTVPPGPTDTPSPGKVVVITCEGMIDDGLYKSIKRRSAEAVASGADYIIFEIDTYGGLVKSADDIATYLVLELGKEVHTVAYVTKRAISAGAMISVSCRDIVMRRNTTLGDCAPITMGDTLEGVEREKQESFIRAIFTRAAEANGYPEALLRAMVSRQLEVYRVKNLKTGGYEFFETKDVPKDAEAYDLDDKELVVRGDEILTLTASKALEYGVARAVVDNRGEAIAFLEQRDGVVFQPEVPVLKPVWSEQMVRWINSPAVMAILVMVAMLGIYIELNTPGVGLAGLVAVICIVIIVGSKYLIGMANWVEIAILVLGLVLLGVEIFVIPGFGLTGVAGIMCIALGLFGMLIRNAPGEAPWPKSTVEWEVFMDGLTGFAAGFIAFLVVAAVLVRYLPESALFKGLKLAAAPRGIRLPVAATGGHASLQLALSVGQVGRAISTLRPAGQARFDDFVVDVVSQGEFVQEGADVQIIEIHGNRVIVRMC